MTSLSITESRPTPALASLHSAAGADRDYLFASRPAQPDDLILVAWLGSEAVGYLAATDEGQAGLFIWEHVVVPAHRGQGIGERLLQEAARRVRLEQVLVVDPLDELDRAATASYYRRIGFRRRPPAPALVASAGTVLRMLRRRLGIRPEAETPVSVVLGGKAAGVVVVDPAATVASAITLMVDNGIGALVVSSDGRRVEGILSERDLLVALERSGPQALGDLVVRVCTSDVLTATLADSVAEVMSAMTVRRARHVPVTDAGRLVGIVSVGDLVLHRLLELDGSDDLEPSVGGLEAFPAGPAASLFDSIVR
ncbi:MAG: GNAT family N-acetyltransferase [Acidimicrobiales bacterium]